MKMLDIKMQDMKMTDGVCSSRRITSIFDIFRIGVVTSYGEGMLNLLNLFSLKRLPLLSQFHIVLFYHHHHHYLILSVFYVLLFHVLHCHVLQFHVLSFNPTFSCPAFSAPP